MVSNFGKTFDGFYGSNIVSPSFATAAIEVGGYNHSFDDGQDIATTNQENQANHEFDQHSLWQWHQAQAQSTQTSTQEQIHQANMNQSNLGGQPETSQIGLDINLESEIIGNGLGLSAAEAQKLQTFRHAPKINFDKVLRF